MTETVLKLDAGGFLILTRFFGYFISAVYEYKKTVNKRIDKLILIRLHRFIVENVKDFRRDDFIPFDF